MTRSGLDRLPPWSAIPSVRAGLTRDLRHAECADARDGLEGAATFADVLRRALARLDRIEALYGFLDAAATHWPRDEWPTWPAEVAALDLPIEQV